MKNIPELSKPDMLFPSGRCAYSEALVREIEIHRKELIFENQALRSDYDQAIEALVLITRHARSWHDFHHGSNTVRCDYICDVLPTCEAVIAKARSATQTAIGDSEKTRESEYDW